MFKLYFLIVVRHFGQNVEWMWYCLNDISWKMCDMWRCWPTSSRSYRHTFCDTITLLKAVLFYYEVHTAYILQHSIPWLYSSELSSFINEVHTAYILRHSIPWLYSSVRSSFFHQIHTAYHHTGRQFEALLHTRLQDTYLEYIFSITPSFSFNFGGELNPFKHSSFSKGSYQPFTHSNSSGGLNLVTHSNFRDVNPFSRIPISVEG